MAFAEPSNGLLFDKAQDRRLADIFAPCITLILQLRASRDFGDADVLRRRIKELFEHAEPEAVRLGHAGEEISSAKFALVAFIDETILSSSWSRKDQWVARPLQLELFDRYDAGEAFFERLAKLLQQPAAHADALEVYYLCMTLGFKGRYQIVEQDRLRTLIEETYRTLSRLPGLGAGLLAPHGKPRDQVATEARSKMPLWVLLLFVTAIGFLAYIGMSLYISNSAEETVSAIDQVPRVEAVR